MSVLDQDKIDAIGISKDGKVVTLMIADHLNWEDEYTHLICLQEKINAYISFIESGQYKEIYPQKQFQYGIIQIHFRYELTDNAMKFLQIVQDQVGEIGIQIKYQITGETAEEKEP